MQVYDILRKYLLFGSEKVKKKERIDNSKAKGGVKINYKVPFF